MDRPTPTTAIWTKQPVDVLKWSIRMRYKVAWSGPRVYECIDFHALMLCKTCYK